MSAIEVPALLLKAVQIAQRRGVSVGELLTGDGLRWVAILTHGYSENGSREIFGFVDLGIKDSHAGAIRLSQIRVTGDLLEGDKWLPSSVTDALFSHAGGEVWVRSCEMPMPVTLELFRKMMLNHESEFDFEASGKSGEWYLRFRSDDAVIFIAATQGLISELSELLPGRIIPVDSSFVFAS